MGASLTRGSHATPVLLHGTTGFLVSTLIPKLRAPHELALLLWRAYLCLSFKESTLLSTASCGCAWVGTDWRSVVTPFAVDLEKCFRSPGLLSWYPADSDCNSFLGGIG